MLIQPPGAALIQIKRCVVRKDSGRRILQIVEKPAIPLQSTMTACSRWEVTVAAPAPG